MADQADISAWWAGVAAIAGGIVTAIGAAVRGGRGGSPDNGKPERNDSVLVARLDEHERRLNAQDRRIDDVFRLLEKIEDVISSLSADVREALTALRERRADK